MTASGHILAALLLAVGLASAQAQVFRCEESGRTVYSDKPCASGGRTVDTGPAARTPASPAPASPAAARKGDGTGADARARCAAGHAPSCKALRIVAQHEAEMADLSRRCQGGEAIACNTVACVQKGDAAACGRAEGRGHGAGWRETANRVESRPTRMADGSAGGERVRVISIACDSGAGAVIELGGGGARIAGQPPVFPSVDAAARHACGRAR
jgi:hypothetical protein